METLGQLLKSISQGQGDFLELVQQRDLVLWRRLELAAEAAGQSPQAYLADTVQGALNDADEERWATLLSHMRSSAEPGYTFVDVVLRSQLAADGQ